VLELEVLIGELGTVDRLAASSISFREITSLDHEVLDDTVESRAFVTESLLASSESTEVLSGLGDGLAVETDGDAA